MKYQFILIGLLFAGCHSTSSADKNKLLTKSQATLQAGITNDTGEDITESPAQILHDFYQEQKGIIIDTSIDLNNTKIEVTIIYKKIQNDSFLLPHKFFDYMNIDSCRAWNMMSVESFFINKKLIVRDTAYKTDFSKCLYKNLTDFGILLFPEIDVIDTSRIIIRYSISIPLTDVGIPVKTVLQKNGISYQCE